MKRAISLAAMLLILSIAALADIARPQPSPKDASKRTIDTMLMIRLDHQAKDAVLKIPKSQIRQLRAQLDEMDSSERDTAAVTTGINRTQTIVSGSFLSLALVFGGIWFARSGNNASKTGKALAIVTILACAGSAATFVLANAGPPTEARSITGKMFTPAVHMYGFGSGRIRLETSTDSESIELIVPDPKPAPGGEE
ncbi:MAG: hypothetical protein ABI878_04020 [Acidobacteriota bacterium]